MKDRSGEAGPDPTRVAAGDLVAILHGPASRALARSFGRRGHERLVAAVVHVVAPADRRTATEAAVAMRLVHGYSIARGSTTARMREAIASTDAWLRSLQRAPGAADETVYASLLATEGDRAYLARVGASGVVYPGSTSQGTGDAAADESRRPPAQVSVAMSLGGLTEPAVRWDSWAMGPGDWALVLEPVPREQAPFDEASWARLPAQSVVPLLPSRLGDDLAAVVLQRRGPADSLSEAARDDGDGEVSTEAALGPPASAPPSSPVTRPTSSSGAAPSTSPADIAPPLGHATETVARALGDTEQVARSAALAGARVLRSTLPDRGPRAEVPAWAQPSRWLAYAALVFPVVVVTLAVLQSQLLGGVVSGPASGAADSPGALTATTSDGGAPAWDVPLYGMEPVATLPGRARDERHLVMDRGQPYVLNVAANRVDLVASQVQQQVLARGTVVGDAVVGNLLDLLWVPAADESGAGSVVALDAAAQLWSMDGGVVRAVPRSREPPWDRVERVAGSGSALYALEQSSRQVLRHAADAGREASYSAAGTPWLAAEVDLTGSTDIAVGDAVYVLWHDGRLGRYADGRLDWQIDVDRLAPPTGAAAPDVAGAVDEGAADLGSRSESSTPAAYSSARLGWTLVADSANGRIVVVGPSGELIARLVPPAIPGSEDWADGSEGFADLHDVWWNEPGGRIYIVSGATLFAAPLAATP